jgi:hypothetical protein
MSDDATSTETNEPLTERTLPMPWLDADVHWGVRAKRDGHGLRFSALNVDIYGDVPDVWENKSEIPRGAIPTDNVERMGYSIFEKSEVWSELCADLYEEAIQRRWQSSIDIPWETLEPLDTDVERAIDQVCTLLSEYGWLKAQTIGRWLSEISYGFIEVKLFLGTVIFDSARMFETFRKRALANGGGLGRGGKNIRYWPLTQSMNWSEFVVATILHDSFMLTVCQYGAQLARNEAERRMFRLTGQDLARHLAYAQDHTRYMMLKEPQRREEIHRYLTKAEYYVHKDADETLYSAIAVILSDGREMAAGAMPDVAEMRRRQVESYLRRLETAHLGDRRGRLHESFQGWLGLPPEEEAPAEEEAETVEA